MELRQFSAEEFSQRFAGAQAGMAERGLDALLVGTGVNLQYFCGFPSPTQSSSRPFFLLLPRAGDPALIVQAGRQYEAARFSWVRDIRVYERLGHLPAEILGDVVRARGIERGAIGLEWGHEMRSDLPTGEILEWARGFPGLRLADGSEVIWRQRMIKSEAEIALIRRACAITSRAYARLFDEVHEGMTEEEVARTFVRIHAEEGSGVTWMVITSGPGNYDFASKPPTARRLARGDLLWLDAGCNVGGYWSDFSRGAVVGGPSDAQRHAAGVINRITQTVVDAMRPGVEVGALGALANRLIEESGLRWTSIISGLAQRVGHGLGMNVTEPPSIAPYDHTPIQPGMVLTMEPGVATDHGIFHHEENVLVTATGVEILSAAPTGLATLRT
jgi:Xaa-Pro aminopeptidase